MRISSLYPSFSRAERLVADAILKDPKTTRALSITQLGQMCRVSQATVNRFCRTLGCDGYKEFKLALVEELVPQRNRTADVHSDVDENDTLPILVQKVLALDIEAIRDTLEYLNLDIFQKAVDALVNSRVVCTYGVGSSLPVAMDLYYRFVRAGLQCRFTLDSHMQAISAGLLGPGDVAVAISYSGETQDTLDCVELAAEAGATTVCITNFPQSSLAQRCQVSLITSAKKTYWMNEAVTTRLAQLALSDALCVAVSRHKNQDIDMVINRIERSVARKRHK
jgi:RpiR family carbohydrate utilization transcriptional regulator